MGDAAIKRYALLSVTNKTGVLEFARELADLGYVLLSTGGTAQTLRTGGLAVIDVAEHTGSPEILGGRVKTLHPRVHGGILYDRDDRQHEVQAAQQGIRPIDIVVVNLYRFKEEAVAGQLSFEQAIEHIDIGGPAMLRAAAKNWQHVMPVIDPNDYSMLATALRQGGVDKNLRRHLAAKTFAAVSAYDSMIAAYLSGEQNAGAQTLDLAAMSEQVNLPLHKLMGLRYGENPHQQAGLYSLGGQPTGFATAKLLQGKELSYNNILDLDAATALVADFKQAAAVIIKHTNPCGVAIGSDLTLVETYKRALASDPKSAFGGIVAFNRPVTEDLARAVIEIFTECIVAPEFSEGALRTLATKPALRALQASFTRPAPGRQAAAVLRSVQGGLLVQTEDLAYKPMDQWQVVSRLQPTKQDMTDLEFAMIVAKHVKSNAVVYARDGMTVGIGAGQMSRIDSAQIAEAKAREEGRSLQGAVLASDAFFPFRDTVDFAARQGVRAIVQPGGSKRDAESIEAADEHGLSMVFTGERHFRH